MAASALTKGDGFKMNMNNYKKGKMKRLLRREIGYPIIDHILHKNGKGVLFSYPYPCNMEEFKRLISFCDEHNLTFWVSGSDEYGFGTFKITFEEKD